MLENDAPEILHSDNGGEFVNRIIEAIGKLLDVELRNGQVYNPQEQVSLYWTIEPALFTSTERA